MLCVAILYKRIVSYATVTTLLAMGVILQACLKLTIYSLTLSNKVPLS